jgi:hypothetical protein
MPPILGSKKGLFINCICSEPRSGDIIIEKGKETGSEPRSGDIIIEKEKENGSEP